MTAILWSLFGAFAYGVSDFIGGLAARKSSPWPVAFASSIGAALTAAVLTAFSSGTPSTAQLLWAAFAGVGGGVGTAFLYRGLSAGRIGVVAPVSAVCAAALPVLVFTLTGEHPPLLAWLGIAAAMPGIWMVSLEEGSWVAGPGIGDGAIAGLGFGVSFVGLGHVPQSAGWSPLIVMGAVSAATICAMALATRERVISRQPVVLWGLLGGVLATSAMVGFIFATSHGLVSIASVLVSLYPATTIILAITLLHERVHRIQQMGMALCAGAVALVAVSGRG
jgi:drug/metabolite transporter (DMT)-like permease